MRFPSLRHAIARRSADFIYPAEAVPPREVLVILGARPRVDGRPSLLLEDRLLEGATLFHAGKAQRVLLSGRPDEIRAMGPALSALGVDDACVLIDDGSYRTLDTFVRAREVFELRSLLVVTNAFHLPRSLFLARALGHDAVGVAARERQPFSRRARMKHGARERIATVRAILDVARQRPRRFP